MKGSRFLTFSLRSLLILVTVLGIWLGVVVNRAREQREAVKAIQTGRGEVRYDWQFRRIGGIRVFDPSGCDGPTGPAWLRRMIGDEFFQEVEEAWFFDEADTVFFHGAKAWLFDEAAEKAFLALSHLPSLRHTGFLRGAYFRSGPVRTYYSPHAEIHDKHITPLSRIITLESLNLSGTAITDDGIRCLARLPRLRSLNLQGTRITGKSVPTLHAFNALKELDVAGTQVGDPRNVEKLRKALPGCKVMGTFGWQ